MKKIFVRCTTRLQSWGLLPRGRRDVSADLIAIASELAREADFDSLMTQICVRTQRIVGSDRCRLFLHDDDAYALRFDSRTLSPDASALHDGRVPLDHPLVRRVIESRRVVTLEDADTDLLPPDAASRTDVVHVFMIAPLLGDGTSPLGFITAESHHARRSFDAADSTIFMDLANLAALAIERNASRRVRDWIHSESAASDGLAALGRFASSIAHDFNNRMTAIVGTAELIADDVRGTLIEADLEELLRSVEASAGLTQRLFDLSIGRLDREAACSVTDAFRGIHGLLRRLVPEDIDFSVDVDGSGLNVGLDPQDLEQIITNLSVALVRSCQPGAGIHVAAKPIELDKRHAQSRGGLAPGRYVEIQVARSGDSIDSQDPLRNPARPASSPPDGPGLGLAIVSSLVQDAGGSIQIDSKASDGSCFVVLLPRLDGDLPEDFDRRLKPTLSGYTGTILLVDDDEPVRRVVRRSLVARGHKVLEAGCGSDALDLMQDYAGDIEILLTDVVMPGMSGIELAKSAVRDRPNLQILFMSGYAPGLRGEDELEPAHSRFVPKPFSTSRIAEAIDTCFAGIRPIH